MTVINHPPFGTFEHPTLTANGEARAVVPLRRLETLWINTGTLCNITCDNCYIQSGPHNDRLVHLTRAEVRAFLDQAAACGTQDIGLTGGEPFMNPDCPGMIEDALEAGFRVLVLTNAMRPMQRFGTALTALNQRYPGRLTLRVSLDHYQAESHERLRGQRTWQPALDGLIWLVREGFTVAVAARMVWGLSESVMRICFRELFAIHDIAIDAEDPTQLVLFPEMTNDREVPEITEKCWSILGKSPDSVMCASSRMVIKRKGAQNPVVVACTLIPYDPAFELGDSLATASRPVTLKHHHCTNFCVLGGACCNPHGSRTP